MVVKYDRILLLADLVFPLISITRQNYFHQKLAFKRFPSIWDKINHPICNFKVVLPSCFPVQNIFFFFFFLTGRDPLKLIEYELNMLFSKIPMQYWNRRVRLNFRKTLYLYQCISANNFKGKKKQIFIIFFYWKRFIFMVVLLQNLFQNC